MLVVVSFSGLRAGFFLSRIFQRAPRRRPYWSIRIDSPSPSAVIALSLIHICRIEPQRLLNHFTRIHRCTVDGTVEHLPVLDPPVARIQKQHRKEFMLEACQFVAQVLLDQRRGSELSTTLHLQLDGLACRAKNLIHRHRQVVPLGIAHQQRGIERGKESCDMIMLRLLGRNCPEPWLARRSAKQSGGRSRPPGRKRASTRSP